MREGWREVRMGDALTQHVDPITVEPELSYTNLGVQWYVGGTFQREQKRGADMKATRLFRVRPGQFVYNRMFVTEGSFALVAADHAGGVVSNEFPLFDVNDTIVLPEYLILHFQQPKVWSTVADQATGTTKSRRRWKESQFVEYRMSLPPLAEQRRVVDLIAAIDDAIKAAASEVEVGTNLLDAILDAVTVAEFAPVSSVASVSSGASWGKADVRKSVVEGFPVLTIANTKPDGSVTGKPTYVSGLSPKTGRLGASSIVAIRTNGSHDRIGNVYRVPDEYCGAAVSAFQLIVEPELPNDSDYLYWMMRRPSFQAEVTRAASGSTGLGNIAASKLRSMTIPWPEDASARADLAAVYEDFASTIHAARTHTVVLRTLRSNLLTVLLSGEHEISSSYDKLLAVVDEGVAA